MVIYLQPNEKKEMKEKNLQSSAMHVPSLHLVSLRAQFILQQINVIPTRMCISPCFIGVLSLLPSHGTSSSSGTTALKDFMRTLQKHMCK